VKPAIQHIMIVGKVGIVHDLHKVGHTESECLKIKELINFLE